MRGLIISQMHVTLANALTNVSRQTSKYTYKYICRSMTLDHGSIFKLEKYECIQIVDFGKYHVQVRYRNDFERVENQKRMERRTNVG